MENQSPLFIRMGKNEPSRAAGHYQEKSADNYKINIYGNYTMITVIYHFDPHLKAQPQRFGMGRHLMLQS